MKKKQLFTATILIAGILLLLNLLAREYTIRLDFTADKRYTLNQVTKDILNNLTDPITVTVYFSEDLPPQLSKVKREFKDMLQEYGSRSGGKLVYEFINPNDDQATEQKAIQSGVQPREVQVREKDQVKNQKVYMGAVLQMGQQKEVIPLIFGQPMEYALSSNIKKLSATKKKKIAFLQGHGEPPLNQLTQLNQTLSILYKPEALFLTDTTQISEGIETIVIVAPKDSIPANHFKQLDDFLADGGKIAVAVNKLGELKQLNQPFTPLRTGLETWLKPKGITFENNVVIDVQCSQIIVPRQVGNIRLQSQERFFYFPVLSKFSEHPAAKGLDAVLFQFTTPVKFSGDTSKIFTPLAYSSERSGVLSTQMPVMLEREWKNSDFNKPRQVMAAALEGQIVKNGRDSRMVIFANGSFIVPQQQGQPLNEDNINFMANAIDWLSDDTGLIELRTKQVQFRPLRKDLSESYKNFLKYFNFLFPILLVLIYGVARAQKRKTLPRQRMSLNITSGNNDKSIETQNEAE